jgi:TonB-dependent siderophore receptor
MKHLLLSFSLCSLCLCGLFIYGEDKPSETKQLDEVVVTASRVPQSLKDTPGAVTVITKEEIQEKNAQDVGDVLKDVAGLKVLRYGSMGSSTTVHIRGLYSRHVVVMVDGRPLNSPETGEADLSGIPVDNIERVEIVRGPYSALYGANAVSGVVNIITKQPPTRFTNKLTSSYGTWRTWLNGFEHGLTLDKFSYLLIGNYNVSNGPRDNSDYRASDFSNKMNYKFSEMIHLDLAMGYSQDKSGLPGSKPPEDKSLRQQTQLVLGNDDVSSLRDYMSNAKTYWNGVFTMEHLQVKFYDNDWVSKPYREWVWGSHHSEKKNIKTEVYGVEAVYTREFFPKHQMTFGVSMDEDDFKVKSRDYDITASTLTQSKWDADRTTSAIFLQDQINLKPVMLTLGGRWDHPEDFDAQTSFKSNLNWSMTDQTTLRLSYGNSFCAPSLNALYYPADPSGQGNPNLTPEKGTTIEFGLEHLFGQTALVKGTIFKQYVRNMIAWAPTGPPGAWGNTWQPDNLNKAKINGLELESNVNIVKDVTLNLSYTYLDAKQTAEELINSTTSAMVARTRKLAYAPAYKLDGGVNYQDVMGLAKLCLNMDIQYVAKTYQYYWIYATWPDPSVTTQTKEMPGFWLVNLKLRQKIKTVDLFLGVDNLTNKKYTIQAGSDINDLGYPMPGRSVTGGLTLNF